MKVPAHVNIAEIRKPELDAQLVADGSPSSSRSASCSAAP
jgi:ribosomal protein S3